MPCWSGWRDWCRVGTLEVPCAHCTGWIPLAAGCGGGDGDKPGDDTSSEADADTDADTVEGNSPGECSDEIDNDGDGDIDCADQDCEEDIDCSFTCENGEVIAAIYRCSGYEMCEDGTAERGCPDSFVCDDGTEQGPDGRHLKESDQCDNSPECADSSDESSCEPEASFEVVINGSMCTFLSNQEGGVYLLQCSPIIKHRIEIVGTTSHC